MDKPHVRCYNYDGGTQAPCGTTYYDVSAGFPGSIRGVYRVESDDVPADWEELVALNRVPFVGY